MLALVLGAALAAVAIVRPRVEPRGRRLPWS
jgi:hypothetical protein